MATSLRVRRYLDQHPNDPNPGALAYYAGLDQVETVSPNVTARIEQELADQRANLKLIASENFSSLAVQQAMGNLLTDKYAEGYPGHRFYAGCDNIDAIESEAADLAKQLFGADHAFVQPHSGADANIAAFLAILSVRTEVPFFASVNQTNPTKLDAEQWQQLRALLQKQKLLALDYYSGGHLTHGYRFNFSSRLFDTTLYTVDRDSKLIDLKELRRLAEQIKPTILLAGYSAYTRNLNFRELRSIADSVGAVLMVDMAHFAGLVAGGVMTGDHNPVPHAQVLTSTTHKTLRGPRGGLILCNNEFADAVDKSCPMVMGGPLPNIMAAKAVAFREALQPEFKDYAHRIVANAQALAAAFQDEGLSVLTGGTDNHIVMVDVAETFGLTGRQAESALRECGITLNRNALPFDPNGPWYTSGLRFGTAAITTLGLQPADMTTIAKSIKPVLASLTIPKAASGTDAGKPSRAKYNLDPDVAKRTRATISELLKKYPLYPELDID
jgi:glycine hydroxymethyltransferase